MTMSFYKSLSEIKTILKSLCDVDLSVEDYDALMIKTMADSNCLVKNGTSKQTHIAITGETMSIFPYVYQTEYIDNRDENYKNFFMLKTPVRIFEKNCAYVGRESKLDFQGAEILDETMCVFARKGAGSLQLQVSRKSNDSKGFIEFRKLMREDDLWIVLKRNKEFVYDSFIIKSEDAGSLSGCNICELNTNHKPSETTYVSTENIFVSDDALKEMPHQRIFYGAPGTGKSYQLNKEAARYFGDNFRRVTFYPGCMYGNFVGSYKPVPVYTGEEYPNGVMKQAITYKYTPGPLVEILVESLKHPENNYLLIIEELNRANAASVFGDTFQLLDRDEEGASQYPIVASADLQAYLFETFANDESNEKSYLDIVGEDFSRISFPKNLFIWATMNSADQGVMPLDTAFKRRWDYTYIGIDDILLDDEMYSEFEEYYFIVGENDDLIKWNDFRTIVNENLVRCHVPEDKLIGPYFISRTILESHNPSLIKKAIKEKVLMYIFNDAGRTCRSELFSYGDIRTYTELCDRFDVVGQEVFLNKEK